MNQDNRVLSRKNAREPTVDETGQVQGAIFTATPCTFNPFSGELDGPYADGCHL